MQENMQENMRENMRKNMREMDLILETTLHYLSLNGTHRLKQLGLTSSCTCRFLARSSRTSKSPRCSES